MSIIAETLDRLEGESTGLRDPLAGLHKGGTGAPRSPAGRGRFPLKRVAAFLVLAGGAGLGAWYWNGLPDGAIGPSFVEPGQPAAPAAQVVAAVAEETPAPLEPPALPAAANTPSDRSESAALPIAAATPSAARAQPTQALAAPSPAARASDEALAVIGIDPAVVENDPVQLAGQASSSSKPSPVKPAVSSETETAQPAAIQQVPLAVDKQAAAPSKSTLQSQKAATAPAKPPVPVKPEAPALAEQSTKSAPGKPVKASPQPVAKAATVAAAKPAATKPRPAKTPAAPVQTRQTQKVQPTVAQQQPDAVDSAVDSAVEQARIALSRGQYPEALDALQALAQAPEKRADFWLLKGSSHLGLGQLDLAEQAFTKAQPLAPGNAQVAIQLAILKQEKDDHAGALKILGEAAGRHPNMPEVYLNQGYSQLELGAMRDAGHSFRVFLRLTEGRSLYAEQRKAVSRWLAQTSSVSG